MRGARLSGDVPHPLLIPPVRPFRVRKELQASRVTVVPDLCTTAAHMAMGTITDSGKPPHAASQTTRKPSHDVYTHLPVLVDRQVPKRVRAVSQVVLVCMRQVVPPRATTRSMSLSTPTHDPVKKKMVNRRTGSNNRPLARIRKRPTCGARPRGGGRALSVCVTRSHHQL